jgi:hypothetical protein
MKLILLCSMLSVGSVQAQTRAGQASAVASITPADLMHHISIIADDSMLGRGTPGRGVQLTAAYVASEFRRAGLRPAGDQGSYLQRFSVRRWGVDTAASAVRLTAGTSQASARFGVDARFIDGRMPERPIRGPLVLVSEDFAGSVRDQMVLLVPDFSRPITTAFNNRVLRLAAAGPKVVLILSNRDSATFAARLQSAQAARFTRDLAPLSRLAPIIEVHERALRPVLDRAGIDPTRIRAGEGAATSVPAVVAEILLRKRITAEVETFNVVGILGGSDPVLRREYLTFSAHIDHIGITPGLRDSINNGADDNASGVAGLLELVEAFSLAQPQPRRSLLFLAPGAEELGLLGSAHFVEHSPVPLPQIVADVNMDLIGRNWTDSVIAVGIDQSSLGQTLEHVVQAHPELRMTPIADRWPEERIFYRSDHYNFARQGVPILFFTSGTHPDYHRPTDEANRIDVEKESRLVRLLYHLGAEIANSDSRPQWIPESYEQVVHGQSASN